MSTKLTKVVDLRSDTLSMPTEGMRKAIFEAQVGDDLYEEDPTVRALEMRCAALAGKEAALYVPSGTMANLISILVHCDERSSEVILGKYSYMSLYEQRGICQFGGISIREIPEKLDGTLDVVDLGLLIRMTDPLIEPTTKVVCVENAHMSSGGRVLPLRWLDTFMSRMVVMSVKTHLDGCRVFNAAAKLDVPVSRITSKFDSISISFAHGLGAPTGGAVIGSADFIKKARRVRRALGGATSQIGFMAAAAMYALDNLDHLKDDHEHTQMIAQAIREVKNPYVVVPLAEDIHSNILLVLIDNTKFSNMLVVNKLNTCAPYADEDAIVVKASLDSFNKIRFVLCINNSRSDVEAAIIKIKKVVYELKQMTRKENPITWHDTIASTSN